MKQILKIHFNILNSLHARSSAIVWKMNILMQSFAANLATTICIVLSTAVVIADCAINFTLDDKGNNETILPDRDGFVIADVIFSSFMTIELICSIIASGR